jgi:hypothetical protein
LKKIPANLLDPSLFEGVYHIHTPWDDIKVFGEVSFSHTITRPENGKSVGSFLGTDCALPELVVSLACLRNNTIDSGVASSTVSFLTDMHSYS